MSTSNLLVPRGQRRHRLLIAFIARLQVTALCIAPSQLRLEILQFPRHCIHRALALLLERTQRVPICRLFARSAPPHLLQLGAQCLHRLVISIRRRRRCSELLIFRPPLRHFLQSETVRQSVSTEPVKILALRPVDGERERERTKVPVPGPLHFAAGFESGS